MVNENRNHTLQFVWKCLFLIASASFTHRCLHTTLDQHIDMKLFKAINRCLCAFLVIILHQNFRLGTLREICLFFIPRLQHSS